MRSVNSSARVFTIDKLIEELKIVAKDTPRGRATKVCIGDWEGNLGAFAPVETLEVAYDDELDRVTIFCDPHERCYSFWESRDLV